jgi:hypothetical protein
MTKNFKKLSLKTIGISHRCQKLAKKASVSLIEQQGNEKSKLTFYP